MRETGFTSLCHDWLVDSGATCHIVSDKLSGFRVVKKYDRTANLFNALGGLILVSGVVEREVHFWDVFLRLEEVLVADVGSSSPYMLGIAQSEDYRACECHIVQFLAERLRYLLR